MRYARAALAVLAWTLDPRRRLIAAGVGALALFGVGLWTGSSIERRANPVPPDPSSVPSATSPGGGPFPPPQPLASNAPVITPAPAGGSFRYITGNWLLKNGRGTAPGKEGGAEAAVPAEETGPAGPPAVQGPDEPQGTQTGVVSGPAPRRLNRIGLSRIQRGTGSRGSAFLGVGSEAAASGGETGQEKKDDGHGVDRRLATIPDPFRGPVKETRATAGSQESRPAAPRPRRSAGYNAEEAAAAGSQDSAAQAIRADDGRSFQIFEGKGPHDGGPGDATSSAGGVGEASGGNAITPR